MKKYKTEKDEASGLLRITALIAIPRFGVKVGDKGGLIEKESNLSHDGDAWVSSNAQVSGNAQVCGDTLVCGNTLVTGNTRVSKGTLTNAQAADAGQSPAPPLVRDIPTATKKAMLPQLTVEDIRAEFDRVNAGIPSSADKLDTVKATLVAGSAVVLNGAVSGCGRSRVFPVVKNTPQSHPCMCEDQQPTFPAPQDVCGNPMPIPASYPCSSDIGAPSEAQQVSDAFARGGFATVGDLLRLNQFAEGNYDAMQAAIASLLTAEGESPAPGKDDYKEQAEAAHAARQQLGGDYVVSDIRAALEGLRKQHLVHNKKTDGIDELESVLYDIRKDLVEEASSDSALDQQVGGAHYKDLAIQPVEFIYYNKLGFCEGSVIKYICRYKSKNGVEDLRKARHYIDLLIEMQTEDD